MSIVAVVEITQGGQNGVRQVYGRKRWRRRIRLRKGGNVRMSKKQISDFS
jgi:hypothetical protein